MARGSNPNGVWGPKGRGFNMAVVQHQGQVVHLTEQVAWDEHEQIVGKHDIAAQTRQCFVNIRTILNSLGGTMDYIVSLIIYFQTGHKSL